MLRLVFACSAAAAIAICSPLWAEDISAAKCPVSGKAVSKDASVDYKGAKVYFCCNNCAAKFAKETAKYAVQANLQLVVTGQAVQKSCPLSGGKTDASTALDVSGAKVAFCCNNCKGKISKMKPADQVKKIFTDKVFDKNFEIKAASAAK
jgi:YHS domain-containing protein